MNLTDIESRALDWIVQYLKTQENRCEILYTKSMLEGGKVKEMVASSGLSAPIIKMCWADSYSVWRQIPKYWLAEAVVIITDFTAEETDEIDAAKPGQFRQFCSVIFGYDDAKTFPRMLLTKLVMLEFLRMRAAELGDRWKHMRDYIDEDGIIDWEGASPFQMHWGKDADGAKIDVIRHTLRNEETKIRCCRLNERFRLSFAWSDVSAQFTGHKSIKPLAVDLFEDDVREWKFKAFFTKEHLIEVASAAKNKVQERELEQSSGKKKILHSADKKRMEDARARKQPPKPQGLELTVPPAMKRRRVKGQPVDEEEPAVAEVTGADD